MKKFVVLFLLLAFTAIDANSQNQVIYLIDNSGSMSGYYKKPESTFKLFSKALIKNFVKPEDYASVYLFTKTEKEHNIESPKAIFKGKGSELIPDNVIANFNMMKGNDGDYGATDIIEALDKSISELKEKSAVIWIITDNISDYRGTGDSSFLNTLDFYKRLRNDEKFKKILLYPIPEKITENGYISPGYVVYGIVYSTINLSQTELEKYDKLLRETGIKQKAITLKPLDIGTLVLVPKINQSKIYPGKLFFDGKVLRGYDFEEGEKVRETFNDLVLKSNLFPYIIKSARLDVRLENFTSSDYSVKSMGTQTISPSTVSNVSPEGEVKGFTVFFDMPEITPNFSLNTVFKEDFSVGGNLVLEVSNVDILLDENYMGSLKELFALPSIPEIFYPVLKDKKIITQIPLEIRIKYGPWRLFVLIGILTVIIALLVLVLYFLLRKKCFSIIIDNSDERNICLNSFSSFNINHNYSPVIGVIKKSFTGNITFKYSKFTSTPGMKIILKQELPVIIEYEEDNRTQSITLMLRSLSESGGNKSDNEIDTLGFH